MASTNSNRLPLCKLKDDFICAEIGVWRGDFSHEILKFKPKELPASHCAFLIELIPALNISAWKALSLIASAIIPDVKGLKLNPVIIGKP